MARRSKKMFRVATISALSVLALGLLTFAIILNDLPDPEQFETRQVIQSTKIYDRTGETLLYEVYGEEKRTVLPFDQIPESVKKATIAIEDSNFYTNPAFDIRGIIRAFLTNIKEGRIAQGGSTITQQLARNAFLSTEQTLIRKIKELIVAIELEDQYTKDEILRLYLNQIPYGGNAYGIEAAAQTFFGKHAKDLTLAETALLVSLPRGTAYYSPWGKHVDELLSRKNKVLEQMEKFGYITTKEKDRAQKFPILDTIQEQTVGIKAPHFVLKVQEYLNSKYGEGYVQGAGLRVITSLDLKLQEVAERVVVEGAARNTELYNGHNAALVAQDATTGQILALVGSKDYFGTPEPENCAPGVDCNFEGNFNVATQGLRQPGSAMKPFAYVTAFQKGYSPDTILFDVETEFASKNPKCPLIVSEAELMAFDLNAKSECFHPQNFDERFRGPVTMRTGLSQSINVPAVKTLYLAGIDATLKTAHDFGITTLNERGRYGLSLVLGGGEVTLFDLVGAYSVFAQEGVKHRQTMILNITDINGNVIETYKDSAATVMDPQYVRLLNDVLTDVDSRAGLFVSSLPLTLFPGHEVALKTGTTNDYRDAWAMGYTPDLVIGVWAGNNNNDVMIQRGSSLLAAIPMWSAFLREALATRPLIPFTKPEQVLNTKPILNGKHIVTYKAGDKTYPHVHTILQYLDKNDPQGPAPKNPGSDSQYENWETPILKWAETNIPNFAALYNKPLPAGATSELEAEQQITSSIVLQSPKNGDFLPLDNRVPVQASITSPLGIAKIQLFFNNALIDQRAGNFGSQTTYSFILIGKNPELQNKLQIKVTDTQNNESVKEVILFK
ncbi:MAG: transglycosylase domain-containing protein [bacterium]|nr:transglycosylase domain-containing protein [bacterium]